MQASTAGREEPRTGIQTQPQGQQHAPSHAHGPSLSWQAIKFALVGASGTIVTFVLLTLLHKGLGWEVWVANIPAYAAGMVNNYLWNRHWTFRHVERRNVLHQGTQFFAISLVGLVLNTFILQSLVHAGMHYALAFLVAAGIVYCWNFFVNHRITFRHHAPAPLQALRHPHLPGHHAEVAPVTVDGD
jgi:putative flippase GtrA